MKYLDIMIDFFENKGVKSVFAYPGEQILPIYRALHENSKINCIDVKHEQASAHAADGYFRITNEVGICLATAGPGATNLTTGIATAFKDSSSVLAITGRCSKNYINKNYFQEVPMNFLNFEKGYFVENPNSKYLINSYNDAYELKKPISINIPANIYDQVFIDSKIDFKNENNESLENAISTIKKHKNAKNPVLLVGQGIYGNLTYSKMVEINEILKKLQIPILTTYPARGVVDENFENVCGMIGRRGSLNSNELILKSDAVFSIGASLSYNTLPESIRDKILYNVIPLNLGINSTNDIKTIVNTFNENVSSGHVKPWGQNLSRNEFKFGDYSTKIHEILEKLPKDTIITTDAGNHTVFVSLLKKCVAPRNIISSHSMGTMGFGLPASIGVKFGCSDYNINREVVSISGDGGFQMNIQELGTVAENNLKILIVVMKNNHLNMFGKINTPDFNKIADAYGIENVYIQNSDEIGENVSYFLKKSIPYVMVVECENEKLPKPFI
uniref:Thiamine pyrophosphate protein domain protein TPP-binding n=1 Tax=Methanococcus maripaludis (strain C6 / ATCC BAA-1332) TaxID=444158 RepID=A9A8F4_METM6